MLQMLMEEMLHVLKKHYSHYNARVLDGRQDSAAPLLVSKAF